MPWTINSMLAQGGDETCIVGWAVQVSLECKTLSNRSDCSYRDENVFACNSFQNHLHRDTHLILPRNDTSDDAMQDNSQQGNISNLLWMINMLLMNDCLFSRVDIVNHISSIDVVLHTKSIIYYMALRVITHHVRVSTHHATCSINKIIIVHLVDCTTWQANVAILRATVTQ